MKLSILLALRASSVFRLKPALLLTKTLRWVSRSVGFSRNHGRNAPAFEPNRISTPC